MWHFCFHEGMSDVHKHFDYYTSTCKEFGFRGQFIYHSNFKKKAKEVIEGHKAGRINGPIIISGFGRGANAAVRFYNLLSAASIPVRAVFAFGYKWTWNNKVRKFFGKGDTLAGTQGYQFILTDNICSPKQEIDGASSLIYLGADEINKVTSDLIRKVV